MANLSMYRGDTRYFNVTVTENGLPVDITGCTLVFTAKSRLFPNQTFTRSTGDGSVTLTGPTHGVAQMRIDPANTLAMPNETFDLDTQWVLTDTHANVTTIETGILSVTPRPADP